MSSLDPGAPGWHWSPADLDDLGRKLGTLVAEVLGGQGDGPAVRRPPHALVEQWRTEPLPARGAGPMTVLDRFAGEIAGYPFGNAHPRFSGWVNSPPHPLGVAGAALAAAMNPSVAGGNHAAVHLEHQVVRWFLELVGWGDGSTGLMTSGGSAATLSALAAARHEALRRIGHDDRRDGLVGAPPLHVYASSEAHSCVTKAVEALGLGSANIVLIGTRSDRTMDPVELDRALQSDRASGVVPVAVVASIGTVNTGAVDPLAELARVATAHDVWLHVDGAYGGPAALLLDEWRDVRDAMSGCHSVALDPHKWLYAPVDAGVVLFRDGDGVRDTFSLVPPYLRTEPSGDEPVWFSEYGLEQTRPFRALKVWMQLQHLGRDGYHDLVERDIAVARWLRDQVAGSADFELLGHGMSIVCFRHRPSGVPASELDEHNRRLLAAVQATGNAFLAGTTLDDRFAFRACIVNPTTTTSDMQFLLDEIRRHASPAGA